VVCGGVGGAESKDKVSSNTQGISMHVMQWLCLFVLPDKGMLIKDPYCFIAVNGFGGLVMDRSRSKSIGCIRHVSESRILCFLSTCWTVLGEY
jgi:hypothetical protein